LLACFDDGEGAGSAEHFDILSAEYRCLSKRYRINPHLAVALATMTDNGVAMDGL
jgi:hypothetical protein